MSTPAPILTNKDDRARIERKVVVGQVDEKVMNTLMEYKTASEEDFEAAKEALCKLSDDFKDCGIRVTNHSGGKTGTHYIIILQGRQDVFYHIDSGIRTLNRYPCHKLDKCYAPIMDAWFLDDTISIWNSVPMTEVEVKQLLGM
jgi:hypothetical protein